MGRQNALARIRHLLDQEWRNKAVYSCNPGQFCLAKSGSGIEASWSRQSQGHPLQANPEGQLQVYQQGETSTMVQFVPCG